MKIGNTVFEEHPTIQGFWVSDNLVSTDIMEQRARGINALNLVDGHTALCARTPDDSDYVLYLIPHQNPVEIARLFEVGKGAEWYDENAQLEVLEVIRKVHRKMPIAPFFADQSGFKFVFQNGLGTSAMAFLEMTITTGTEAMLGSDGKIGRTILEQGFVHLWWD